MKHEQVLRYTHTIEIRTSRGRRRPAAYTPAETYEIILINILIYYAKSAREDYKRKRYF
jgi:hypothetical protein